MASGGEDGKVVFKYEGDTTGIDTANKEVEQKVKNGGAQIEQSVKESARNANKVVSDEVDKGVQSIPQKFGITAQNVKASIGAIGVACADFLKNAIQSAADAQQKTMTVTNLLKNQGMTAAQAAQGVSKFTGSVTSMSDFSGGEAKDALTVLIQKGLSYNEALGASSTLANVAAGNNMSLADAADLVADAYNGKTRALTMLGILSKDEAKNLGNQETASISMADVQDRLNQRFGGAAQADLKTYSGQMKEANNQFSSAKVAVGSALLPVLNQLLQLANKILVPVLDFLKNNPKVSAGILVLVSAFGLLFGGMSLATTVAGFFNGALGISTGATIAQGVAASVTTMSLGAMVATMLIAVGIIAAVIAVVVLVATHLNQLGQIARAVGSAFGDAINGIKGLFDGLIGFLTSIPGRVGSALSGIGSTIRGAFDSAIGYISSLPSEALGWGRDIVQGIADGIKGAAHAVGDAVNGVAQDIRSFLHFSQPDKGPLREFPEWPRDMMQTWADELSGNDTVVLSAVKKVTGNVAATVQTGVGSTTFAQSLSAYPATNISKSATTIDNSVTKAPVFNINGPINVQDKGSRDATLQQIQFIAPIS